MIIRCLRAGSLPKEYHQQIVDSMCPGSHSEAAFKVDDVQAQPEQKSEEKGGEGERVTERADIVNSAET